MNELNKYARLQFRNCDVGRGLKVCLWEQMTEVVICRTDNNEAIARRPLSGQWILSTSALGLPLETVSSAVKMADDWIESELAKLKEKERANAALPALPPLPPGHRLCLGDEAKDAPGGSVRFLSNNDWYSVNPAFVSGKGTYCTSAPRKFVRCTAEDAERLFTAGAYVEFYDTPSDSWARKTITEAHATIRYRVDKYTIPAGFGLWLIVPTVKPSNGAVWDYNWEVGIRLREKNGRSWNMPTNEYKRSQVSYSLQALKDLLAGYNEIHDGET